MKTWTKGIVAGLVAAWSPWGAFPAVARSFP